MGAAVSNWRLANAVARTGHMGVVSGTGMDTVLVRRLQDGDPGGSMRRGMERFPIPGVADAVLRRYFKAGGRAAGEPYALLPLLRQVIGPARQELIMLAAYVEVWLAREGHDGPVGINLLTKIQIPTLPTLYGAMLAGVSCVLMGSGIPREIPAVLDWLSEHRQTRIQLHVEGDSLDTREFLELDPCAHWETTPLPLLRPAFLPIVASHSLATMLARKANGRVDGLIIEGHTAGGHNAPPRGELSLNERGEPLYGERDEVNLAKIRELGLPFWLAGGAGHPAQLEAALAEGAAGVQVGTLFAYCDESGIHEALKRSVLERAARGEVEVRTDARASPTGYPFKRVHFLDNREPAVVRERLCDLGCLRVAFRREDGKIGYRCPGEPVAAFVRKGGKLEETVGRECLCNGLLAVIGHPQVRAGGLEELPILTSGKDLETISEFLNGRAHYTAADVIDYLTACTPC